MEISDFNTRHVNICVYQMNIRNLITRQFKENAIRPKCMFFTGLNIYSQTPSHGNNRKRLEYIDV